MKAKISGGGIIEEEAVPWKLPAIVPIDDVVSAVLDECAVLNRSPAYKYHARRILEAFSSRPIGSITRGDVQRYAIERLSGRRGKKALRPSSVAVELAFLARCFRFVQNHGADVANSAHNINLPPLNNKKPRFITLDEELALKREVVKMENGAAYVSLIDFTLNTGVRRLEMLSARVEHVVGDTLHIPVTKTSRPRTIALNAKALYEVQRWAAGRDGSEWLFLPAWGENRYHVGQDFCKHVYAPAARAAGLVGFGWRSLRHTFATRCVTAGAPLTVIAAQLGHSSTKMTERYAWATLDAMRSAVALL